ncbi:RDD family protein [Novosphingobium decolorationis]|uniref:RDD family protein n=1 Tax=Novosphingobium decolorationis TaxID=2698673 RepID=A0ABX8E4V9_9SPHN|nr:RDD family protein [Novosphingobium decolorationis]QVM83285.1 RDD family protein [Novosphingobium decolorationis]
MVPYGGFWWRVLAYFIDAILLQIALSIVTGFLGLGVGFNAALMGGNEDLIMGPMVAASLLISFVAQWLYFALLESSKMQATVGKLAIGLIVTDLNGQRISFGRATGRYFAKILSGLILLIGYIMVAFTLRKQGLHDMIASTLVYKTRDPREVAEGADVFA